MAFKMKGMEYGEGTGSAFPNVGKTGEYSKSAAFQNIDKKNKQKLFSKKASDLMEAWRDIKDTNSNRAKQLKKEAKTMGLELDQTRPGDDDPS